jgi:hypothetical protein
MKFTIRNGLSADKVKAAIPVRMKPLLTTKLVGDGYALIHFHGEDYISSSEMLKALSKVGCDAPVVLVGYAMTGPAFQLLADRNVTLVLWSQNFILPDPQPDDALRMKELFARVKHNSRKEEDVASQ